MTAPEVLPVPDRNTETAHKVLPEPKTIVPPLHGSSRIRNAPERLIEQMYCRCIVADELC